jgi:hypothetical protein
MRGSRREGELGGVICGGSIFPANAAVPESFPLAGLRCNQRKDAVAGAQFRPRWLRARNGLDIGGEGEKMGEREKSIGRAE